MSRLRHSMIGDEIRSRLGQCVARLNRNHRIGVPMEQENGNLHSVARLR